MRTLCLLVLLAVCGASATFSDILLLDGNANAELLCTDMAHALCNTDCPYDNAIVNTSASAVCYEFAVPCAQQYVAANTLNDLCTSLTTLELTGGLPLTAADGHFFYKTGHPELAIDNVLVVGRLLMEPEDLQTGACDMRALKCGISTTVTYTSPFKPALQTQPYPAVVEIFEILNTGAAKSVTVPVVMSYTPPENSDTASVFVSFANSPTKYVMTGLPKNSTDNSNTLFNMQPLKGMYGIAFSLAQTDDATYDAGENVQLGEIFSQSSNLVLNTELGVEYGPFCGANDMHVLVSNYTVTVDVGKLASAISLSPNVMPNCAWQFQTKMRVFGSIYWTAGAEGTLFTDQHDSFGTFPDIELFTMAVVERAGTFALPGTFASMGKLKEIILSFAFPSYRNIPSVVWTANINSLYMAQLIGYAGYVLGDVVESGANFWKLTIDRAHLQFHGAGNTAKVSVLSGPTIISRVQCLDAEDILNGQLCLPEDLFSDPANYTNPVFTSQFETIEQHNFTDIYALLHQLYIPSVSDASTIDEAVGAALMTHTELQRVRSFADVSLVGGLAALQTNLSDVFGYAAVSMGMLNFYTNVRVLHIDANTDNSNNGTIVNTIFNTNFFGAIVNISVSTQIETADTNVAFDFCLAYGLVVKGKTSLFADPAVMSAFVGYFSPISAKQVTPLTIFHFQNQVFDGAFWENTGIGSRSMMQAFILENVTLTTLDFFFTLSGSAVVPLRSLIITDLHATSFQFPSSLLAGAPALQTFIATNSNLTGTVDNDALAGASSLTNFDVSDNSLLGGTLSETFLNRDFTSVFNIENTDIAATVTLAMPMCTARPGFTCKLNAASTMEMGCACTKP